MKNHLYSPYTSKDIVFPQASPTTLAGNAQHPSGEEHLYKGPMTRSTPPCQEPLPHLSKKINIERTEYSHFNEENDTIWILIDFGDHYRVGGINIQSKQFLHYERKFSKTLFIDNDIKFIYS